LIKSKGQKSPPTKKVFRRFTQPKKLLQEKRQKGEKKIKKIKKNKSDDSPKAGGIFYL
jgi:hypothetical protein